MFVSTVIPSTMLNIDEQNYLPYQFTIPYNFVRGRNISVNVNPAVASNHGVSYLTNSEGWPGLAGWPTTNKNRFIISVPDNVTEYTANVDIYNSYFLSQKYGFWKYNVNITCNITNNTITFAPVQTTVLYDGGYPLWRDNAKTMATLITIATIM